MPDDLPSILFINYLHRVAIDAHPDYCRSHKNGPIPHSAAHVLRGLHPLRRENEQFRSLLAPLRRLLRYGKIHLYTCYLTGKARRQILDGVHWHYSMVLITFGLFLTIVIFQKRTVLNAINQLIVLSLMCIYFARGLKVLINTWFILIWSTSIILVMEIAY